MPGETTFEATISQVGDTPVHRVAWTTAEATTGEVRYGTEGLDLVVTDDVVGTEHEVVVAGIGAGLAWQAQAVSEGESGASSSEIFDVEPVYLPSHLSEPTVEGPASDELDGFELVPLPSGDVGSVVLLNRLGQIAWWVDASLSFHYRARFSAATQTVSWLEATTSPEGVEFVSATLDQVETRVAAPALSHHDFALTPEGGFLTLVLDERDFDGQIVYGEALVEVGADGVEREIWSTWDSLEWDGGGKVNTDGTIEWPHANSMHFDAEQGKVLVSLHSINTVVQIDRESGDLDWKFGGAWSDWDILGDPVIGQHGPMSFDGGNGLAVLCNGEISDAAVARAYTLDPESMVATPLAEFDHDAKYTGVLLGNVSWAGDGTYVVDWGSAGVIDRVSVDDGLVWSAAFRMGLFVGFSEHVPDFAGVTR